MSNFGMVNLNVSMNFDLDDYAEESGRTGATRAELIDYVIEVFAEDLATLHANGQLIEWVNVEEVGETDG